MELKEVTRLHPDGRLATHLVLSVKSKYPPNLDTDGTIQVDLGGLDNGGMKNLTDLGNLVAGLLVGPSMVGQLDGIANCKSFGLIFLIQKVLEKRGYQLEQKGGEGPKDENLLRFAPSLIAALLDREVHSWTAMELLNRRIYCPQGERFNAESITKVLKHIEQFPAMFDELCESSEDDLTTDLLTKIRIWTDEVVHIRLKDDRVRAINRLVSLCRYIRNQAQFQTAATWESVCENLNDLKILEVSFSGQKTLLTSRPTSIQIGIFYRMGIPTPPMLLQESYSQPVSQMAKADVQDEDPDWVLEPLLLGHSTYHTQGDWIK